MGEKMFNDLEQRAGGRSARTTLICGALVVVLAAIVLWGWVSHNISLVRFFTFSSTTMPNTALGLLFLGLSLVVLYLGRERLASFIATMPIGIGTLTLIQYLFKLDIGIDTLFFSPFHLEAGVQSARMAPQTALCLVLSGLPLSLVLRRPSQLRSNVLMLFPVLACFIAFLAILGYCFGVTLMYGWGNFTRMAMPTAIGFMLFNGGVLAHNSSVLRQGSLTPETLRRRVLLHAVGSSVGTSVISTILVIVPLAAYLEHDMQADLLDRARVSATLVDHSIGTLRNVAVQISSRSRVRELFEEFLDQKSDIEATRTALAPLLADIARATPSLRSMCRYTVQGLKVACIGGEDLQPSKVYAEPQVKILDPFPYSDEWLFPVRSPVLSVDGHPIGVDYLLFHDKEVSAALANPASVLEHGIRREAVQKYIIYDTAQLGFVALDGEKNHNHEELKSLLGLLDIKPDGTLSIKSYVSPDSWQFAGLAPLSEVPGAVLLLADNWTAFAPMRKQLAVVLVVMLTLSAGAAFGSRSLIGPLARQWSEHTEALRSSEERLKASERQLKYVTDRAHVGLAAIDAERRYLLTNKAYLELRGLGDVDVIGKSCTEVLQPTYNEQIRPKLDRAFDGERTTYDLELPTGRFLNVTYEPEIDSPSGARVVAVVVDITSRKAFERELLRREEQLRALANAMPQIVFAALPDGSIDYYNERWYSYTGCSPQDLKQEVWKIALHPEDAEHYMNGWAQCMRTGEEFETEVRIRDNGGRYRWHLGRAVPVRDATGTIVRWYGTYTDIEERKDAEVKLRAMYEEVERQVAERTRALRAAQFALDTSHTPIFWVGADGGFAYSNEAAVSLFGYSTDEFRAMKVWDLDSALSEDTWPEMFRGLRETGAASFETSDIKKDGTYVPVDVSLNYFEYEQESYLFAFVRDVSERKKAEEALRRNEERLSLVLNAADVGIWDWNIRTDELVWSPRNLTLYGLPPETEMNYGRFIEAIHPQDREHVDSSVRAILEAGADVDIEMRAVWPDGAIHWVASRGRTYYDADKKPIRMSGVSLDITRLKEAEATMIKNSLELSRSNAELEQFAYIASHDLQEPLRKVASYCQLLDSRYGETLGEEGKRFITKAVDGTNRLQTLISDILLLSRVNTSAEKAKEVDSEQLLNEVLSDLEVTINKNGARVTVRDLPTVVAEARQLRQLFQNLIGNALKYRKPDVAPEINVTAERVDDSWRFAVQDNGIGIDPKYYDQIFEVFRRLHGRGHYSGNGIGLSICQRIVHRHGGRIWVESQQGVGSTFYFTIPEKR